MKSEGPEQNEPEQNEPKQNGPEQNGPKTIEIPPPALAGFSR
jgi:hypothetical protein